MDQEEQEVQVGSLEPLDPILKVLLRGGGKQGHDLLKAVGYLWLMEKKNDFVDFEIGGFDVLGIVESKADDCGN